MAADRRRSGLRRRPGRENSPGQVLVLFALGITVLFAAAGLAFDVGRFYSERRFLQNAADAAALAGARYVNDSATFHGTCAAAGGNAWLSMRPTGAL